jgi:hypothetical protein
MPSIWRLLTAAALLTLATGCPTDDDDDATANAPVISDVEAVVSDVVTMVVTVRWTTDVETLGHVEFGIGGELNLSTPVGPLATEHEVVLLGLPAGTEGSYRVVAESSGGVTEGEVSAITTGPLPPELPNPTVTGSGHDGYMAVPLLGAVSGATILDAAGRIVWFHMYEGELDLFRVRLSRDGASVLFNAADVSDEPSEETEIVRVALDGSSIEGVTIPWLAHDFVELPDGTLTAIALDIREIDGEDVRGDKLVEVAPDGTQTEIWSTFDCWDPAEVVGTDPESGWTWTNAIDYDPVEDDYTVGIRNLSSIVRIDRATGACEWALGGAAATLEMVGSSSGFLHQHQFQVLQDSVLVFDNDGGAGLASRAIEYELDLDAGTAEQTWSYTTDPPIYSFVLGDVNRFDDGDTLITWSVLGQIDRVSAAGESEWRLNTAMGYALGFNTVYPDLYASRW